MSEQPATIARYVAMAFPQLGYSLESVNREAKALHTNLKELLRTKEPFDRDVDFQRKKRVLLLIPPFPWADNLNKVSGNTT